MLEKFKTQKIQKPKVIYGGSDIVIDDIVLLKKDIVVEDLIDGV